MEPSANGWLAKLWHEVAVITGFSELRPGDVAGRLSQQMRQVVTLVVFGGLGVGFVFYTLIPMLWPTVLRPALVGVFSLMGRLSFLSVGVASGAALAVVVGHRFASGTLLRRLNWGLVIAVAVIGYISTEAWMGPRAANTAGPVASVVAKNTAPTETHKRAFAHPDEYIGLAAYAGWCIENQTGEQVIRETEWEEARKSQIGWWSSASAAEKTAVELEINRLVGLIGAKRVDGKVVPSPGSALLTEINEKILLARKTPGKS